MNKLEHITLSNNYITTLFPSAFVGLKALQTLNLNSNRISNVPRDLLEPISNLTRFELSNNKLIWANLKHLDKLKYLSVCGNVELNLSTLESLSSGRSLIYLDLSNTNILQIPNQGGYLIIKI
jgi:Leucine-rich repeat (LRR) protein